MAAVVSLAACGQPNPKILESSEHARGGVAPTVEDVHSEPAKIRQLIALVRASEHTFVINGLSRSGPAAAERLQVALDRDVDGVRSALEFVERIAAPAREDGTADRVVMGPEREVSLRQWYLARLAEIEGRPVPSQAATAEVAASATAGAPKTRDGNLQILDALLLVERSGLKFVAPPRKQVTAPALTRQRPGRPIAMEKRKPKAKEYTSREFADMLRKKWEFLGADIDDLDTFLDEIASDSFATMEPYVVVKEDGTEELFRPWLEARLADKTPIAAGGGP